MAVNDSLALDPCHVESVSYTRVGNRVVLRGVSLGRDPEVLFERGTYQVWYVPSYKVWAGLYRPWSDAPATYYLMKVEGDQAFCIGKVQPGPFYVRARRMLQRKIEELLEGEDI